jgi:ABC-type multidrug transport system fused ATPase/permease subunit
MDIGKSFSYPFEDDEWLTKLLLGAVVSAVPILNFAWTGYTVDILRNVTDGVSKPMPDWSDFGDKFVKGFFIWAAGFIYTLPAMIIACLPLGLLILPASMESSNTTETLFSIFTGVGILFLCLLVFYLLAFSFYFPAVYINFARKGTFGSCFEISEIIKIVSENTSKYLTAWLVSIVGAIVVGILVMIVSGVLAIIFCIGWVLSWVISSLASVYLFAIFAHLFGQVVAKDITSVVTTE